MQSFHSTLMNSTGKLAEAAIAKGYAFLGVTDHSKSQVIANGKRELAAEVACLLAFSAIRNNDKVGLILFSDQVELFVGQRAGFSTLHCAVCCLDARPGSIWWQKIDAGREYAGILVVLRSFISTIKMQFIAKPAALSFVAQ